jgi:hypothetical protein
MTLHGPVLTLHSDHEVVAKLAELDMVVADLEHANTRVATVERRNVSMHTVLSWELADPSTGTPPRGDRGAEEW